MSHSCVRNGLQSGPKVFDGFELLLVIEGLQMLTNRNAHMMGYR